MTETGPSCLPTYRLHLRWTGAGSTGTAGYTGYSRVHVLSASGKPDLAGSADPAFRGDTARWSPEKLLLGAISGCHQLWYLHLCAETLHAVASARCFIALVSEFPGFPSAGHSCGRAAADADVMRRGERADARTR